MRIGCAQTKRHRRLLLLRSAMARAYAPGREEMAAAQAKREPQG
jgi:hypothetical protein